MPDINIVHPHINKIKNQKISIQVSLDGFSFSISSVADNKCILFRHYKFSNLLLVDELIRKTESVLSTDSYLNNSFASAEVTYISQNSAIIPSEFFVAGNLKKYFEFTHTLAEFDEIHYSQLKCIGAYNVFSIPGYISQLFYSAFPNVKFNHQAGKLINFTYEQSKVQQPVVVAGINSGFFDLVVFDDNRLILSNSFQYSNSTDIVYFFLYACRQLKLEIEKLNVYALGEAITNHRIIEELAAQVNGITVPDIKIPVEWKNITQKQVAQFYNIFIAD